MTMPVIDLALLEQPCPDCPTDVDRKAHAAEWQAWNERENAAYVKFVEGYERPWGAYEAWRHTDTYDALLAESPGEWSEIGCFECSFTGTVPTDQGRVLLDFIRRYTKA